jgi:Cu(I)/Ag(I) efflux system membrane protein CusA/SilA
VLLGALLLLALTVFPFARLGKEFMPPLNEGTLLYMPTAVPGISITEATKILQIQDRQLKKFPEVTTVFGKAGQAETSTDPAPLSMFETIVSLKPFDQWPRGMTWEKFVGQLNATLKTPGMANIFWMPIQTRTEMLTTGFRSALGIKVFGPDLQGIENVGVQIEKAITDLPDTRSAFAERTTGGYFLDFDVNREAAARYGLTVGNVNDVIETAIGGKTITTTVEARERYPVSARYAPDFRQDLDSIKRVLIPTPTGAQIPISLVANIHYRTGPPSIRNENGQLVGFVLIDPATSNIDGYVRAASKRIAERVRFPAGYYTEWAGQFQYIRQAEERLKIVVPLTLLIIFVLIYFNTRSVVKTCIVLLAVPFSLIGAFWLLYLLGYHMSVAVWIGLLALAGLDAETGVVMLLYLDHAWEKCRGAGRMNTMTDLYGAVQEGAVQRIRPKIMTVCAILFGLLPIMWSPITQTGADVMKRIAAPMIGGVITSAILELLLYPVIYVIWRKRDLPEQQEEEAVPFLTRALIPSERARLRLPRIIATVLIAAALIYGGNFAWHKLASRKTTNTPFATQSVNDLTVTLSSSNGEIKSGDNDVLVKFRDSGGNLVDVGTVKFELKMNMPGMQMNEGATVEPTSTPGVYRVKIKVDMAGDWMAKLSYEGPRGNGETSFNVNTKS